jgi:hypothetical protein
MNLFQFLTSTPTPTRRHVGISELIAILHTVDSILKSKTPSSLSDIDDDEEARRGFLESGSDEDADDDPPRPHDLDSGYAKSSVNPGSLASGSPTDDKRRRGGGARLSSELDRGGGYESGGSTPSATGARTPTSHQRTYSYPPTSSTIAIPTPTPRPKRIASYGTANISPPPTPKPPLVVLDAEREKERQEEQDDGGRSSFGDEWGDSTTSLDLPATVSEKGQLGQMMSAAVEVR